MCICPPGHCFSCLGSSHKVQRDNFYQERGLCSCPRHTPASSTLIIPRERLRSEVAFGETGPGERRGSLRPWERSGDDAFRKTKSDSHQSCAAPFAQMSFLKKHGRNELKRSPLSTGTPTVTQP